MAKNKKTDVADDSAVSTSARSARENDEIRRQKKAAQKRASGSGNGSMKTQDRNVGAMKNLDKATYEERQLRVALAADAAVNDPTIQEISNQKRQIAMIDAALVDFGQRSNPLQRRTDAIKAIRLETAYAGRITRDALFAANRRRQLADAVVLEGDAV